MSNRNSSAYTKKLTSPDTADFLNFTRHFANAKLGTVLQLGYRLPVVFEIMQSSHRINTMISPVMYEAKFEVPKGIFDSFVSSNLVNFGKIDLQRLVDVRVVKFKPPV